MGDLELHPCPCCGKEDQIKVDDGWKHGKCDRCGFACSVHAYGKMEERANDKRI